MSSSGTSRNETLSLTIKDFMNATREYHNEVTIQNMIQKLENQSDIVPTFQLYRKKTHYPHITFCTPEATSKILLYLKYRYNRQYNKISMYQEKTMTPQSKLFHFNQRVVNKNFERLNDKIG